MVRPTAAPSTPRRRFRSRRPRRRHAYASPSAAPTAKPTAGRGPAVLPAVGAYSRARPTPQRHGRAATAPNVSAVAPAEPAAATAKSGWTREPTTVAPTPILTRRRRRRLPPRRPRDLPSRRRSSPTPYTYEEAPTAARQGTPLDPTSGGPGTEVFLVILSTFPIPTTHSHRVKVLSTKCAASGRKTLGCTSKKRLLLDDQRATVHAVGSSPHRGDHTTALRAANDACRAAAFP